MVSDEVDTPITIPPEIAKKDEDDQNIFDRLLAFSKQVHVVTVKHHALGPVKVHYAILESGEEPQMDRSEKKRIEDADANVFVKAMWSAQESKCWAMVSKAMRIGICNNSCCHGPILEKYRLTEDVWRRLKAEYPDFTIITSGFILNHMQRDVADFLPSLATLGLPSE